MRTGLFALGIFPFILAFGAKWNLVTFVTGYSHEKLQVSCSRHSSSKGTLDEPLSTCRCSTNGSRTSSVSHLAGAESHRQLTDLVNSDPFPASYIPLRHGGSRNSPQCRRTEPSRIRTALLLLARLAQGCKWPDSFLCYAKQF